MDDLHGAEETAFVVDEVSNIIKEAVESAIGGNAYAHNKVSQWSSNVVEQCINQLTKLQKPFKVVVMNLSLCKFILIQTGRLIDGRTHTEEV